MNLPNEPPAGSQLGGAARLGELAGFWRRLIALIIDFLILWVVDAIVGGILGVIFGAGFAVLTFGMRSPGGGVTAIISLVQFLIFLAYFAYLWSARGQTLGDWALGIRVVRTNGSRIDVVRGVARVLALWLSFAILLVPAIISVFTVVLSARKQALHDMVVDTQVVRN